MLSKQALGVKLYVYVDNMTKKTKKEFHIMMKTTHNINVHPSVQTHLNNNMLSFHGPLGCVKVDLALFDPTSQLAVQLTHSPANRLHIFASRTNKK